MIWVALLIFLVVLTIAALFWSPRKGKTIAASVQEYVAPSCQCAKSERDKILDEDLSIVADALRTSEMESRKAAALERIKSISPKATK